MDAPDALPPPVLILASRESGGSLLAALLGAHPAFAEAPQLNVLAFEEAWQMARYCAIPRDSGMHGLLRFIGWHLTGEQSVQAAQAAQRWLHRRQEAPMADLHRDLRALVAPRALVDYSPLVAQNGAAMARAAAASPEARIVHLTRDPLAQGAALCAPVWQTLMTSLDFWDRRGRFQPVMDAYEIGEQLIDWSAAPPVLDPQFAWHRTQRAAARLVADLGPARARHLRREDLAARPEETLRDLLLWLDADAGEDVVRAMLEAPPSPFAAPGPYHAPFGIDFEMIGRAPAEALREEGPALGRAPRAAALPWRGDGEPLLDAVVALGRELGYSPLGEGLSTGTGTEAGP